MATPEIVPGDTPRRRFRGWLRSMWPAIAVVTATTVVVAFELNRTGAGISRQDIMLFWQLVDLRDLTEAPLTSVWNLHTQPPLYNLVVGLVAWSPLPLAGTLYALFMASLWGTGVLLADLLRRWGAPPVVGGIAAAVGVCTPSLLWTVSIASYELPVAMLIVAAVWSFQRFMERGTGAAFVLLCAVLSVGGLTRSILSIPWILAVIALALAARRVGFRHAVVGVALPVLLIGGVMLKNQILFDNSTTSSWFGFNLQRGISAPIDRDIVRAADRDGSISGVALVAPFRPYGSYANARVALDDECWAEEPGPGHPAVTRRTKEQVGTIESSNFNNRCYLPVYAKARSDAITLARDNPGEYLRTRRHGLALTFSTLPIGQDDPPIDLTGQRAAATTIFDRLYPPVMAEMSRSISTEGWNVDPFGTGRFPYRLSWTMVAIVLGWVVAVFWAASRLLSTGLRNRAAWDPRVVTIVMIGLTCGAILGSGVLFELAENSRFRAVLDPLLIAGAVTQSYLWLRRLPNHRLLSRTGRKRAGSDRKVAAD